MPIPAASPQPTRLALAEIVRRQLQQVIEDGQLVPGEALDEGAIERWTGASRTPVREAIDRLHAIGLLDVQPQRTTRVSLDDPARARSSLQVLSAFLPACLALVLPVLSATERRRLANLATTDGRGLLLVDGMFAEIVRLTGNDRVTRSWEELAPFVRRHWTLEPTAVPTVPREDRDALRSAIVAADAEQAAALLAAWFHRDAPVERNA